MQCPRCKTEHSKFERGKIVSAIIEKCIFCGFTVRDSSYVHQTLEKVQNCISDFKQSNDKNCLYKAEAYFNAALAEVEEIERA